MKVRFPEQFQLNPSEYRKQWRSSLFVFDANVLLNMYRYSDETRGVFFNFFSKYQSRIWLPNRAAEEYFENRHNVISQQEKAYEETISTIRILQKNLSNARHHPFLKDETMEKVSILFSSLIDELEENKAIHSRRIYQDNVKDELAKLFNNKVGEPHKKDRLEKIVKEGEYRYQQLIPPGFEDRKKYGETEVFSEQCRKYGDLILWMQIIDESKEKKKDVILVTDDRKSDWWQVFNGKTVGPRPELIKEFFQLSNQTIYFYHADRFLEYTKEFLDESVSNETIEEIRNIRRHSLEKIELRNKISEIELSTLKSTNKYRQALMYRYKRMRDAEQEMENRMEYLESQLEELAPIRRMGIHDPSSAVDIEEIEQEMDRINTELSHLKRQIKEIGTSRRELGAQLVQNNNSFIDKSIDIF